MQHVVIDAAVVRGLAQAYFARAELGLSDATAAVIRDRIRKAANSTFYAYPSLRLNRINWPVEIYAHADAVLESQHLLKHDCRLQLARFADALTHPAAHMRARNTGPGYRFHYLPQFDANQHTNVDSAEYATIVCGGLLFYGQARIAGMAELSHGQLARTSIEVIAVNQGSFPYGGVELARFFDSGQQIAANIGGVPPASFGVVVHDRRTGHDTASQRGRLNPDLARPPVRLVTAPRGALAHPIAYPMQAYAGPFERLEAVGSTSGPGVTIHSRHRFLRDYVQSPGLPGHARLSHPASQSSAPHAGPTLVLEPLRDGRLRDITLSARVAPARTLDDAHALADGLGALR